MNNDTIRHALEQVDEQCLQLLQKSTRFCNQQNQALINIEHILLHMLDDPSQLFSQILIKHDIKPINCVRQIIKHTEKNKVADSIRPEFSPLLFYWFSSAAALSELKQSEKASIEDLILSFFQRQKLQKSLPFLDFSIFDSSSLDTLINPYDDLEDITDFEDATIILSKEDFPNTENSVFNSLEKIGYSHLEKIGEGGMATIYKAYQESLNRHVALKVVKSQYEKDTDFIDRFLREAQILAQLNHPNIIQIYDIHHDEGLTFFAMEHIKGGELTEKIANGLDVNQISHFLCQILEALQSAHILGFIHRDIKPENIMFREDNTLVLTDFGIARSMEEDDGLTLAGSIIGTPKYMSPEQAKGEPSDHRSDLYSVGVLFYQLIENKIPYKGESAISTAMKHILEPIPTLSTNLAHYQEFINKAMAKKADDRFQSGQEMIVALHAL